MRNKKFGSGGISASLLKEKKEQLTLEEVTCSYEFKKMVKAYMRAVLDSHKRNKKLELSIFCDADDPTTAYTDSNRCVINAANEFFQQDSITETCKLIYGVLFHELGHVLYTCFSEMERMKNEFSTGVLTKPENLTVTESRNFDKIISIMNNDEESDEYVSAIRSFLLKFYANLSNRLEDGRIEMLLLENDTRFSGLCSGLERLRAIQAQDFREMEFEADANDEYSAIDFCNLFLGYVKYRECGHYKNDFEEFEAAKHAINMGLIANTASEVSEQTVRIMLAIWPKIEEIINDFTPPEEGQGEGNGDEKSSASSSSNGQSSGQSGNASNESSVGESQSNNESSEQSEHNSSPEELENALNKILENLNKHEENSSGNDEDEKEEKASASREGHNSSSESGESSSNSSETKENNSQIEKNIEKIMNNIAQDNAIHDVNLAKEEEAKGIIASRGRGFVQNYSGTSFKREEPVPYESSKFGVPMGAVKKASKEIQRHLEQDMRTGSSKRKFSGKKFHASKLVNRDFRYFENKATKKDMPKVKVGLVIDESGSMWSDRRCENARLAALTLYEIFERVPNLDIAIYGHSTSANVQIFPYCDFDVKDRFVKERLCNISARRGNMDIVPITVMAEKLLKQDADERVMIIITDGLPYSYNEHISPEEELTEAANKYSKKGIEIIVAALGEDRRRIESIYQNQRFLDIESPDDLPKKLVDIIKRKL